MSTTPTPPSAASPSSLADNILNLLDTVLTATGPLIPFGQYADLLVKIAQKGVSAYEIHTGQPIDSTLIKPIANV